MAVVKRVAMTPSKYAMWRCAIALAHADGQVSNSEINLIHDYWENFDFTEEQTRQLEKDWREMVPAQALFVQIEDKLDRAHLINFARVLFHIDGDFSEVEEKLLDALHAEHMKSVDMRGAIRSAGQAAKQFEQELDRRRETEKEQGSWVLRAFRYLARIDEEEA